VSGLLQRSVNPTPHPRPSMECWLDVLESVDEHELDIEATIGVRCSSVTGHQRQSMLDRRGADQRVVHRPARDAEWAQPGEQLAGSAITEKTRGRKIVCDQPRDRARTPSRRWRQPREDGKRLERGMAGEAKCPAADRVGAMMLVIGYHESNRETRIDQSPGFESRGTSGGPRHATFAPTRRRCCCPTRESPGAHRPRRACHRGRA
jgi:hypothetical protein